jgi:hypothetical protein
MLYFVVGNALQLDNALPVAQLLQGQPHRYVDLGRLVVSDTLPTFEGHDPRNSLKAITFTRRLDFREGDVVVLPQDVGVLTRSIAARVKASKARFVLLPDGIAGRGNQHANYGARGLAKGAVNALLKALGAVVGKPGVMGSSGPHTIFSYGQGWDSGFNAPPETSFVHVAPPRASTLARLGPPMGDGRVLIASQPLWRAAPWASKYSTDWYELLEQIIQAPAMESKVRIRLHPAETMGRQTPNSVKKATVTRALAEDLQWSDVVVTPMSSIAVEALAAGRVVRSVAFSEEFVNGVASYPLFGDDSLVFVEPTVEGVCQHSTLGDLSPLALQEKYCARPESAASVVARDLIEMISFPTIRRSEGT